MTYVGPIVNGIGITFEGDSVNISYTSSNPPPLHPSDRVNGPQTNHRISEAQEDGIVGIVMAIPTNEVSEGDLRKVLGNATPLSAWKYLTNLELDEPYLELIADQLHTRPPWRERAGVPR